MMTLNPPLPPSVPTDPALMGAFALLTSLGNAQATAATLAAMADAKKALDEATATHDAAAATAAQAALSDLEARAASLDQREAAVSAASNPTFGRERCECGPRREFG
jgi:hypothetical protein